MSRRMYEDTGSQYLALIVGLLLLLAIGVLAFHPSYLQFLSGQRANNSQANVQGNPPALPANAPTTSVFPPVSVHGSGSTTSTILPAGTATTAAPGLTTNRTGPARCGDSVCDPDESCSSCPQDCGCQAGAYCSSWDTCEPKEACGDSICTATENNTGSCCSDCGCQANGVCNTNANRCIPRAPLSPTYINATVAAYIANQTSNYTNYTITAYVDDVINGQPVVEAYLYCQYPDEPGLPCMTTLTIAANGTIIDISQAA